MVHDKAKREQLRATLAAGRRADPQQSEHRGRLALHARQPRRRHLGHHLPDHGPADGPQRRSVGAQVHGRAVRQVRASCQDDDGSFRYMDIGGRGPGPAFARTAAGVVALYQRRHLQGPGDRKGPGIPDAVQAERRRSSGTTCTTSTATITPPRRCGRPAALLGGAGSRPSGMSCSAGHGSAMTAPGRTRSAAITATAMACIILQIPNNYLPILQK